MLTKPGFVNNKGRDDMRETLDAIAEAYFRKADVFSIRAMLALAKALEEAHRLGWDDAARHYETEEDTSRRYSYPDAYNQGADAAKAKKRYHENPYPYGTPENDYWRDGFYDAGGYQAKPPIG
jgi:hypothetical protein